LSSSLNLFDDAAAPFDAGAALLHLARPSDAEHHDELRDAKGQLRPQWQQFAGLLGGDLGTLNARQAALTRQIQEDGVTYNVYNAEGGPSRPWSLETLPLILSASDLGPGAGPPRLSARPARRAAGGRHPPACAGV